MFCGSIKSSHSLNEVVRYEEYMTMFRSGRRIFSISAILMLITAALHTYGFFGPRPHTLAESEIYAVMAGFHLDLGSMHPSMLDVQLSLALTMTILYVAIGIICLLLASSSEISDTMIQRIGWVNFLWVTVSVVTYYHYQIPPPLMLSIIIDVFILAGLLLPSGKSS